jgi:endo-beta-N-acetylglucosaminidase D
MSIEKHSSAVSSTRINERRIPNRGRIDLKLEGKEAKSTNSTENELSFMNSRTKTAQPTATAKFSAAVFCLQLLGLATLL